jgi:predicted lactoylglutathione lyase
MIGYSTLGTNDLDRACGFYDQLFATIGESRIMDIENFVVWGTSLEQPGFSIARPFDGNPATVGNGVMIAIQMPSAEAVNAFYAKAMELGASDEGAPGSRGDGFYAGYFRDLDGNKLNAFFMG